MILLRFTIKCIIIRSQSLQLQRSASLFECVLLTPTATETEFMASITTNLAVQIDIVVQLDIADHIEAQPTYVEIVPVFLPFLP